MWMMPHPTGHPYGPARTPMVPVTAKTGATHGNGASTDPPPDDDGRRWTRVRAGPEPGRGRRSRERAGLRAASGARAPLRPPRAPTTPTSELERLASLHQSGALSDDEFAAAKQKVLGASSRADHERGAAMAEQPRGAVLRRAIETCIAPDDDGIADARRPVHRRRDRVVTEHAGRRPRRPGREPRLPRSRRSRTSPSRSTPSTSSGAGAWPSSASPRPSPGPFVIDEAAVIDPNGRQLLLGAAAVADFEGDKIKALRAYFDDATPAGADARRVARHTRSRTMDPSYHVVVEHEPDPLDLAFLEERMAEAAVAGRRGRRRAGVRGRRRATATASSRARPESSGAAAARCTSCGSTHRSGVTAWLRRSWPRSSRRHAPGMPPRHGAHLRRVDR